MSILFASLSLLAASQAVESGFEVPAELIGGEWTIEAKIDGKPAYLLVGTAQKQTVVSSELAGSAAGLDSRGHVLTFGGLTIDRVTVLAGKDTAMMVPDPMNGKSIAGVVGLDVLNKTQIGLDMLGRTWTLWRDKRLSDVAARSWVGDAQGWPQTEGPSAIDDLDLQATPDGFTCETTIGGSSVPALVDLAAGATFLPTRELQDWKPFRFGEIKNGSGHTEALYGLPGFGIGSSKSWIIATDDPDEVLSNNPGQLRLSASGLRTTRFLIDFGARRLWRSAPPSDALTSMALTDIFGVPLTIVGNKLAIGPVSYRSVSQVTMSLDGLTVGDISGLTASDLSHALSTRDSALLTQLGALATTHYVLDMDVGTGRLLPISNDRTDL